MLFNDFVYLNFCKNLERKRGKTVVKSQTNGKKLVQTRQSRQQDKITECTQKTKNKSISMVNADPTKYPG